MPRPGRHLVGAERGIDRDPHLDDGAARIGRPYHQVAAELAHALPHADQPDLKDGGVPVVVRRIGVALAAKPRPLSCTASRTAPGPSPDGSSAATASLTCTWLPPEWRCALPERLLRDPEQRGLDVPGHAAARQPGVHLDGDREAAAPREALCVPSQRRGQPHPSSRGGWRR